MTFDARKLAIITAIFLSGVLWFILMRAIFFTSDTVHYHANFAVYLNDEQLSFDSFGYYEEVTACGDGQFYPQRRAHMHDYVNDVVHVHDDEVTWNHFFNNIGISLGNNVIEMSPNQVYDSRIAEIRYILNGTEVNSIYNQVIGNEDVLLVYHGSKVDISEHYDAIAQSANEYNQTADPSACQGDAELNFIGRLREVIGL